MNRSTQKHTPSADRKCDYVFDYPYSDIDSIELSVPAGYQLEAIHPEVSLKTKFGTYHSRIRFEGDKIVYYRKREHFAGRYPASDGAAIADFYATIYKADRSKMVLVKKESETTPTRSAF